MQALQLALGFISEMLDGHRKQLTWFSTVDRFCVDSSSGTITPVFDGLNRLTAETTPTGSVSYTYDNGGPAAEYDCPRPT
jgi:hypothetical protein